MRSLQARLIASYTLLALVLVAATGLVFSTAFINYAQMVREQRIDDMVHQANAYANEVAKPPEELVVDLNRQFPDLEFSFRPVIVQMRSVGPRGDLRDPRLLDFILPGGERARGYSMIYTVGGVAMGTIFVQPKEGTRLFFQAFYREAGLIIATAVGLAALLGWLFSRWLSGPLKRLTHATAAVAEGDFLQTVEPTGTTELDGLVQQFNRMVERLSDSFRTLSSERDVAQRFASDAAHEMKTPLTALKAFYETAIDRPERAPQVLPRMGRSIERIEGIITGLLQLARLSEGTGLELATGDAVALLKDLEPGFRMLARDAGHTLESVGLDQPLPVRLDPRLLEIAVTNLVTNAIKFTPPGGRITIAASLQGGEAVITVSDTGPGIPPGELEHIFNRFHRGGETQTIPGTGLGLSIVKEAMARMGGQVTVASEVGVGSSFSLRLPVA